MTIDNWKSTTGGKRRGTFDLMLPSGMLLSYCIEIPAMIGEHRAAAMLEMIELPDGVRWFTHAGGGAVMARRGPNPDEPIRGYCAFLVSGLNSGVLRHVAVKIQAQFDKVTTTPKQLYDAHCETVGGGKFGNVHWDDLPLESRIQWQRFATKVSEALTALTALTALSRKRNGAKP